LVYRSSRAISGKTQVDTTIFFHFSYLEITTKCLLEFHKLYGSDILAKHRTFTEEEKKDILSMYAKGCSIRQIFRKYKSSHTAIKKLLVETGAFKKYGSYIYQKKCILCGKIFYTFSLRQKYCYEPCNTNYNPDTMCQYKSERYYYIKTIRKEIWAILKSNPEKIVYLKNEMEKEEGKEFADMVFGKILESDEFKKMKQIQEKYSEIYEIKD